MSPKARLVVLSLLAAAAAGVAATCGPEPTSSEPEQMDATITVSAQVGELVTAVSVEVSAADIRTPIVANIPVTDGVASGSVSVPAGSDRLLTVHAFDDNAIETHRGTGTVNLKEGENQVVAITLDPLTGQQPIVATVGTYTVTLEPADTAIDVLDTVRLTVTVTDASGDVVQNPTLYWGSMNPVVAGVDENGLVTGGHAGATSIVVSYLGVVATAQVVVAGEMVDRIAFDYVGHLYAVSPDGSDQRQLTDDEGFWDREPTWSPDHRRIAFIRVDSATLDDAIYVMNADGSGVTSLLEMVGNDYPSNLAWSPDGARIAFVLTNDDIYVMNADGSDVRNVDVNPGYGAISGRPRWSPDGTRIAFSMPDEDVGDEIYTINVDGSGLRKLTNDSTASYSPSWSPDGSRIAFLSGRDWPTGDLDIYVMDADGSNVVRVTADSCMSQEPVWAPAGEAIAFVAWCDGVGIGLYGVNADGSGFVRLSNSTLLQERPAWSPDASRIAFYSNGEIHVINADGTGDMAVTSTGNGAMGSPVWGRVFVSHDPDPGP